MTSKRRIRQRECSGKVRHASRDITWAAAKHTGTGLHIYRCRWCKSWHAGHMPSWIRRKVARI